MATPKKRLGRGIGGLISQGATDAKPISAVETASRLQNLKIQASVEETKKSDDLLGGFSEIQVNMVTENPFQPRKEIDEEALNGLAESIREEGLLQPIVVRKAREGFELIAGERRLRAFKRLKLDKVPARIIEASDASSASLALIENLQREGLNPIEEALGFASLIRDFDLTQEKAAERLGKSRASIANTLRLLRLAGDVQAHLSKGHLTTGHAKVILGLESTDAQSAFARKLIEEGWSVREAEKQIKRFNLNENKRDTDTQTIAPPSEEASAIRDLEQKVSELLSAEIQLKHNKKKGQLVIRYHGLDDLQRILDKIGVKSL